MKTISYVLVATTLSACMSSTYRPTDGPYLKTVVVDSQLVYRVNGEDYAGGLLGRLPEAVAMVPEAKAYAEQAKSDAVWGLVYLLAGSVAAGLGTGLALVSSFDGETFGDGATIGFSAVAIAGLVLMGVGFGEATSAQVAHLDAINIYNDVMHEQETLRIKRSLRSAPSERAIDPAVGAPGAADPAEPRAAP